MGRDFQPDEWAVILGASSGFGLATARKLAEAGMSLCLIHRDRRSAMPRIAAAFEEIRRQGIRLLAFNVDALDPQRRFEVLDRLATELPPLGRVKVLLHSIAFGNLKLAVAEKSRPGRLARAAPVLAAELGLDPSSFSATVDRLFARGFDELHTVASPPVYDSAHLLDREDLDLTIHAMGTSLLEWTRDILERGLFAADARVFGLTSEGTALAWKGYAAVAAAKAALESVARTIAVEMAPYGIRCNVIQPGVTPTPALAAIPGSEHLKAQARLRNPLGRLTTPEDVAGVVYLLSRPEASWVNGAVLRVDGGEHVSGALW